jgi:hypothetical protein
MSNGTSNGDSDDGSGTKPPDGEPEGGAAKPPHLLWAAAAGGLIGGLIGALIGTGIG